MVLIVFDGTFLRSVRIFQSHATISDSRLMYIYISFFYAAIVESIGIF